MKNNSNVSKNIKSDEHERNGLHDHSGHEETSPKSCVFPGNNHDDSRLYNLVMKLIQIETDWKQIRFALTPCGSTFLVKNYQEIHQVLDSHLK